MLYLPSDRRTSVSLHKSLSITIHGLTLPNYIDHRLFRWCTRDLAPVLLPHDWPLFCPYEYQPDNFSQSTLFEMVPPSLPHNFPFPHTLPHTFPRALAPRVPEVIRPRLYLSMVPKQTASDLLRCISPSGSIRRPVDDSGSLASSHYAMT